MHHVLIVQEIAPGTSVVQYKVTGHEHLRFATVRELVRYYQLANLLSDPIKTAFDKETVAEQLQMRDTESCQEELLEKELRERRRQELLLYEEQRRFLEEVDVCHGKSASLPLSESRSSAVDTSASSPSLPLSGQRLSGDKPWLHSKESFVEESKLASSRPPLVAVEGCLNDLRKVESITRSIMAGFESTRDYGAALKFSKRSRNYCQVGVVWLTFSMYV